jgi:ubiquinone/menaquinone biosynthesis C-methylase UbiE
MELLNPKFLFEQVGITQGMKVADFGCGNSGLFVFSAASYVGESGTVYAVDILKSVLEAIKSRISFENIVNVVPVWTDLEVYGAAKIPDVTLDVALLINTLHQSGERGGIVREAARMIKSGGKLLIVDWKKTQIPFGPPVERRVDKEQIIMACIEAGLELKKDFDAGMYHFGLVFVKK